MLSFNRMITCSSRQRNANVGQKKSLKLQTKKCFVLLRGLFVWGFFLHFMSSW